MYHVQYKKESQTVIGTKHYFYTEKKYYTKISVLYFYKTTKIPKKHLALFQKLDALGKNLMHVLKLVLKILFTYSDC